MSAFDAYLELARAGVGRVVAHEPMCKHTTFRIGGPATAFVECDTISDLTRAIGIARERDSDWIVVGKGSNLLVCDDGYDGVVLSLGRDFRSFRVEEPDVMVCGAGMSLGRLVQEAFKMGCSGFEFAVGIPGTFGGAIYMNAGVKDASIAQVVRSVVVYRPGIGLHRYRASDLPWIYRYSGIPDGEVILEAEVNIKEESKIYMRAKMEDSLQRRKKAQPRGYPNAGSIFRNTPNASAGKLIEDAGFKGYRLGGAMVSDVHANFIVNVDNATAEDVLALITTIRDRVGELYGIQLQPEIKFLGFPKA